jgi:hypothetical protein
MQHLIALLADKLCTRKSKVYAQCRGPCPRFVCCFIRPNSSAPKAHGLSEINAFIAFTESPSFVFNSSVAFCFDTSSSATYSTSAQTLAKSHPTHQNVYVCRLDFHALLLIALRFLDVETLHGLVQRFAVYFLLRGCIVLDVEGGKGGGGFAVVGGGGGRMRVCGTFMNIWGLRFGHCDLYLYMRWLWWECRDRGFVGYDAGTRILSN